MSDPWAIVPGMPRRTKRPSSKVQPVEAGVCLLAFDILSQHGIACPSDAQVLALLGLSDADDDVEQQSYALKSLVLDRLIDGYLTKLPAMVSQPS